MEEEGGLQGEEEEGGEHLSKMALPLPQMAQIWNWSHLRQQSYQIAIPILTLRAKQRFPFQDHTINTLFG
jgi:hypothetical protein